MKRTRLAGMIASLAGLLSLVVLLCLSAPAQSRAHHSHREYAPRIIGRANSFIVSGRIVALRGQRLVIETTSGTRLEFQLSERTTLMEAGELVSIATMDDIALRLADLRLADEVEVVAERAGQRLLAHIVTRTAQGLPVARR